MGDWLHCNNCMCIPGQRKESIPFYFTACGHIICGKCVDSGTRDTCRYCKKRTSIIEINRNLRPDLQMYFRSPKELLEQYVKNLNNVLDFQGGHRSRLSKAHQEQQKKAMKFIMSAQLEIKRKSERERKILAEKDMLLREMDKLNHHTQKLERMLACRSVERSRTRTPSSAKRGGSSSDRSVSSNSNRHTFVATSTPISDCLGTCNGGSSTHSASAGRLAATFVKDGPEPSPISMITNPLTTPDILGIKKHGHVNNNNMLNGHHHSNLFNFK